MLAFITNVTLLLASAPAGGPDANSTLGKFIYFWDHYLNYPGFEIWKFVNLFIFVALIVYVLRKPLSGAFKAKREQIRAELIRAEEAKKSALAKLTEIEAKLAGADSEKQRILREARAEIEQEKARLIEQADIETKKLNDQAIGEAVRIGQVARLQLRRFAVEESIRRADEKLRAQVNTETDSRLINSGIQAIGGLN